MADICLTVGAPQHRVVHHELRPYIRGCLQPPIEELKSRGVEFLRSRWSTPYGTDAGFRDDSGNNFRVVQST